MKKMILYIAAFFKALYTYILKKCIWEHQRRIAKGTSIGLVVVMILASVVNQGDSLSVDMEQVSHTAQAIDHNQVSAGNDSARIELKRSQVSKKNDYQVSGRNVNNVKQDYTAADSANSVVKNKAPLSLVEKVYEDHGQAFEQEECLHRYQYPVEIGYAADSNYDGKQSEGDYIFSRLYDTEDIEKQVETEIKKENTSEEEQGRDLEDKEASVTEEKSKTLDRKELDFLKDVWSSIMPTEPSEVHITQKPEKEEPDQEKSEKEEKEKADNTDKTDLKRSDDWDTETGAEVTDTDNDEVTQSVNEDSEEGKTEDEQTEEEGLEEEEKTEDGKKEDYEVAEKASRDDEKESIADGSYFVVSGNMRAGEEVFVSDIVIKPTGIKGFDKVRIGEDGEFGSSAIITKDADNETVNLYFSDGSNITNAVKYTYSKDTQAPILGFWEEGINKLQTADYMIYCTNDSRIKLDVKDDAEGKAGTGIAKYNYIYGNMFKFAFDNLEDSMLQLPEAFYGRVLMNCVDHAGNVSGIVSKHYLVENQAPQVRFSNGSMCTAPYTLWIDAAEEGSIVSGVQDIICTVNGEAYNLSDMQILENTTLGTDLEVPTKMTFPISMEQEGTYNVEVRVKDYAGNETVQNQTIDVKKPEMVSVLMPNEFTIHIDPQQLAGREQIFSDDITLCNVSDFDVKVTVSEVTVNVKNAVSDAGIKKDCKIYLVTPDTGKKIALKKGKNTDVYSFCLPKGQDNTALYFVGDTTKGSDSMWKDSDISIDVRLSFSKEL